MSKLIKQGKRRIIGMFIGNILIGLGTFANWNRTRNLPMCIRLRTYHSFLQSADKFIQKVHQDADRNNRLINYIYHKEETISLHIH